MNDISIIIPVYNVEKYIRECLESIVNQTLTAREVLLINDGSTDESMAICETYAKKYSYFKIIYQNNRGLSAARNTGLENAKGNYICFIDSDDFIADNMLAVLYEKMIAHGADMAKCGILYYYDDSRTDKYSGIDGDDKLVDKKTEIFQSLFTKKFTHSVCNAIYKREIFQSLRFTEGKIAEDLFIAPHLLLACNKILITSDWMYYYRKREGSIMQSFNARHFDIIEAANQMRHVLSEHNMYKTLYEEFHSWFGDHLASLIKNAAKYSTFLQFRGHVRELNNLLSDDDINIIITSKRAMLDHSGFNKKVKIKYKKNCESLITFNESPNLFWFKTNYNTFRRKLKKHASRV